MNDELRVQIHGQEYIFSNRINEKKEWLNSFNELAMKTFGLSFSTVGGDYEPYVLIKDGKVCSNVSVNQMHFIEDGIEKQYIQLGTVMTVETMRHLGLSRWLMEYIMKEWKDKVDAIYLFANDSVIDFYPKFGFVKQEEYEYTYSVVGKSERNLVRHLNMEDAEDRALVKEKYQEGNPFSRLCMVENEPIYQFYYEGFMKEQIYSIDAYGVIFIAAIEDEAICYEILGDTSASLSNILEIVGAYFSVNKVTLGFTPYEPNQFECQLHKEEESTLFIHHEGTTLINTHNAMFPLLSIA